MFPLPARTRSAQQMFASETRTAAMSEGMIFDIFLRVGSIDFWFWDGTVKADTLITMAGGSVSVTCLLGKRSVLYLSFLPPAAAPPATNGRCSSSLSLLAAHANIVGGAYF